MKVAVVIPCFRVRDHILNVLSKIGPEVSRIYVIDDFCPESSGDFVKTHCTDTRVTIICHTDNKGVGGAVLTGYQTAISDGMQIIVKLDGDGQMDTSLIPKLVDPIINGEADYTKGNRFFDLEQIHLMPKARIFGNAALSFMSKFSTGYWNIFDPTNGFTAIHADVAKRLPIEKISKRYFFETDLLFRLNTIRAVVLDIPMDARYGDETSNLKISKILGEFLYKHIRNTLKRIFYNYYLRDISIASVELPVGVLLFSFGSIFGLVNWIKSAGIGITTPPGTVMLAALPILMGMQLIFAFLAYDISSIPKRSIRI